MEACRICAGSFNFLTIRLFCESLRVFCIPVDATANREALNDPWFLVSNALEDGTYADTYPLGTTIGSITFRGKPVTMKVIGVDLDVDKNGESIPLTVACYSNYNSNNYGSRLKIAYYGNNTSLEWWGNCYFRENTVDEIINDLTPFVKNHLIEAKKTSKYATERLGVSAIRPYVVEGITYDKIFILSARELGWEIFTDNYITFLTEEHGVVYPNVKSILNISTSSSSRAFTRSRYICGMNEATYWSMGTNYRNYNSADGTGYTPWAFCLK